MTIALSMVVRHSYIFFSAVFLWNSQFSLTIICRGYWNDNFAGIFIPEFILTGNFKAEGGDKPNRKTR